MYGIELSSAAVVAALDPQEEDFILDLCCSPGAKLCFIGDFCKHVIGIDINETRLNVCRNIVKKYQL
jgi:16S rRNA C967 or C1407 C5-methylase (RsmB/RsmF family)